MRGISGHRLILFGGKGGVGKTVCSAATGVWLAGLGRKTLVYSADPAHSLSDCFSQSIGDRTTMLGENLFALEVSAKRLLQDLKRRYSDEIAAAFRLFTRGIDLPFERELLRDLMNLSPPGLDELMALTKLNDILSEGYESVVVDMAAGAHAVRLLEAPTLFEDWIERALRLTTQYEIPLSLEKTRILIEGLKGDVASLRKILSDPSQTTLVVVTTPESMALSVARNITREVRSIGIPVCCVLVNQVVPTNPVCPYCSSLRTPQERSLNDIHEAFGELEIVEVQRFPFPVTGMEYVKSFSRAIYESASWKEIPTSSKKAGRASWQDGKLVLSERLRVILFGGKGGCGKTVCSAATGLLMAEKGRTTLVFSTDPQRSLSDVFGQDVGEEITQVKPVRNLYAVQIDAKKLLDGFKETHREEILEIVSSATYFERHEVADFMDLSLPGMDEVMGLLKLKDLSKERKFDLLILDTAPTGHTFRLLEMPDLLSGWVKVLVTMRSKTRYIAQALIGRAIRGKPDLFLEEILRDIGGIRSLLTDPFTLFVPVTVPEEMAIRETTDLLSFLRERGIRVGPVVVNKIVPTNLGCGYCAARRAAQRIQLDDLPGRLGVKRVVGVELLSREVVGLARVEEFARSLLGS